MKKAFLIILIVIATSISALAELKNTFFSNFTSGIITRKMDARIDFEKYANGLRTLENMSVYVYGGAFKRPGTYYVTGVSNHAQKVRLIPFVYSTEQAYVIEAGSGYMRFYMDEGQIQTVDSYTKLLLHGDGSDASTVFTDSSTLHTMTASGNAQIDTGQSKFGTGSLLFDDNNDYVKSADSADWYTSNEAFTYEAWVRFVSVEGVDTIFCQTNVTNGEHFAIFQEHELGRLYVSANSGNTVQLLKYADWVPNVNTWYHVALIRGWSGSTNTFALTVDGSAVTTWTSAVSFHNLNQEIKIGASGTTIDFDLAGGTTTTFVNHAYIKYGDGLGMGSLYLDGTDDRVTFPPNPLFNITAPTDASIDFWVKHDDHAGVEQYFNMALNGNNYIELAHEHGAGIRYIMAEGGAIEMQISGVSQITDTNWHHVALQKVGTTYSIYLDGSRAGQVVDADTYTNAMATSAIGCYEPGASSLLQGYISDFRITHSNQFGTGVTCTMPSVRHKPNLTTDKVFLTFDDKSMNGHIDEFRYSYQSARWSSAFTPPSVAYPTSPAGGGAIYQITSPYGESDLDEIKYVQSADYLYIAHPDYPPYQLTRSAHNNWTLSQFICSAATPFGGTTGYPGCVEFHEERLVWAGTTTYPQKVFMSKSGDYNNYVQGANDADAIVLQIAASDVNSIRWMNSGQVLALGSIGGEWTINASDSESPIAPDNVQAKRQTNFGTENIMPVRVGKDVVHVQYGGKKLRTFSYKWEEDSWGSKDLLLLAEHLTSGTKIRQIAYQKEPNSTLWAILDNGDLLGVTYLKEQNIYAWHKHTTQFGDFESIAVIPGPNDTDQVWFSVVRSINGSTYRYIEFLEEIEWSTLADAFYLDAGLTYSGATVSSISGLTHLAGVSVGVMENGKYAGVTTVSSGGTISLVNSASKVHSGLTYTSTLESIDIPEGFAKWRKIATVRPRFYQTVQSKFGPSTSKLDSINFSTETTPFTGVMKIPFPGAWSKDQTIVFRSDEPYPFTLSGMLVEFLVED